MVRVPRVLIVGGYGVFGRLLAAELLRTTRVEIVIAGRNPAEKAIVLFVYEGGLRNSTARGSGTLM